MGIDMTNFKMIYKDNVYNCLALMACIDLSGEKPKVKELEVTFINEENRVEIIRDEAHRFQFIAK
jgi:hypothetical protein